MSKKRQAYGRSAFPYSLNRFTGDEDNGMTLRQWYAGQALVGLLGAGTDGYNNSQWPGNIAWDAVKLADALMVELDKEEQNG